MENEMLRTLAISTALVASLAGSALCRDLLKEERGQKPDKTPLEEMQEERARRAQDVERDYQAAMKRSANAPTPKVVVDPWGNVRPSAAPGTGKK